MLIDHYDLVYRVRVGWVDLFWVRPDIVIFYQFKKSINYVQLIMIIIITN
jgi:hypothetical protein